MHNDNFADEPTAIIHDGVDPKSGHVIKRTFNVMWPFHTAPATHDPNLCITTIQLNWPMAQLLQDFMLDYAHGDGLETELYALSEALTDDRTWSRKASNSALTVSRIEGAVIVSINKPVRTMLVQLIETAEKDDPPLEKEIRALGLALRDPDRCYQVRQQKRQERAAKNGPPSHHSYEGQKSYRNNNQNSRNHHGNGHRYG